MLLISEARLRKIWGTEDLHRVQEQARRLVGSLSQYVERSTDICRAIDEAVDRKVPLYLSDHDTLVLVDGNPTRSLDRLVRAFSWREEALGSLRFIEKEGRLRLRSAQGCQQVFLNATKDLGSRPVANFPERLTLLFAAGKPTYQGALTASIHWMDDATAANAWRRSFEAMIQDVDKAIVQQIHRRLTIFAAAAVAAVGIATAIIITRDS